MKKILMFLFMCLFLTNVYSQQEGILEALRFQDTDIQLVIKAITQKAFRGGKKVNILVDPTVIGKVDVELINVDWETALKGVLRMQNFGYEWVGKDMIVVSKQKEGEQLDSFTYAFEFANVEELEKQKTLEKMITNLGKITYDKRTNSIWVIDTRANLVNIENVMDKFDITTRQVAIEAKVIEIDWDLTKKLGVKWTISVTAAGAKKPVVWPPMFNIEKNSVPKQFPKLPETWATDSLFQYGTLDATALQAVLNIILIDKDTKVISMPKVTTVVNNTATIDVVTEEPIPSYTFNSDTGKWEINGFEWKKYGVMLKVTPQINKEGFVTLIVKPIISDKTGTVTFSSGSGSAALLPILATQTVETKVVVKDKRTLVIGGLIRDKVTETIDKVPFLGDIPYLEYLFKHKEKVVRRVNLLIFITPKIVTPKSRKNKLEDAEEVVLDDSKELIEERDSFSNVQKAMIKEVDKTINGPKGEEKEGQDNKIKEDPGNEKNVTKSK